MFYEIKNILKNKKFTNFYYFHDLIWKNFLEEKFTKDFYCCFRAKALNAFPIIRYLKKYNIIIPKIYYHIFWLINKPKKINFENRIFYLSLEEQPEPSRQLYSYKNIYNDYEKSIINTEVKR